ncbi:phage holin family protein [Paenibacillus sp. IB182496]|uniref:Phage holin family protein n=1 Tax=Paenibacillus sabuli TaxID=2772509 RepID=A0A927GS77_9BACL|nr:phage holin family protein [Paenibacillus sabuli]MBD2846001.1 phage holin family protein [Paenibacillus sabuli]
MHYAICGLWGLIGIIVAFAFGGWTEALTLLLAAMAVDYVTGVIAAVKEGKGLNSMIGFWGLIRKGATMLIILIAHRVDLLLGSGNVTMTGAIFFYLANELISITENCGRIGLPVPHRLRRMIEVLKDKGDDR